MPFVSTNRIVWAFSAFDPTRRLTEVLLISCQLFLAATITAFITDKWSGRWDDLCLTRKITAYTFLLPCGLHRTSFTAPIAFSTGVVACPVERIISALRLDVIVTSMHFTIFMIFMFFTIFKPFAERNRSRPMNRAYDRRSRSSFCAAYRQQVGFRVESARKSLYVRHGIYSSDGIGTQR